MRIFIAPSSLVAGELAITGDEHHYLHRVRRARLGDHFTLVDGAGRQARAEILSITDTATTVNVFDPFEMSSPRPFIRVLLPLIKGDRMDIALEKLVEVGVSEVVVWPAERSVVKLDADRREARVAKYQLELQAAARQSGRAQVPPIRWADSLAAAIKDLDGSKLVLDPTSDTQLAGALGETDDETGDLPQMEITFVSGPEGGLTPNELARLEQGAFVPVGLGPRVLRAETAPVAAVTIVRALTHS
jgi:16S rRNA (uracil1498-N3)-methyltransferase